MVAIEDGFITQFKAQPQNFVDLNQYGAKNAEEPVPALEVGAVDRAERRADRPRHRRRQHGACATARDLIAGGRPADRPRRPSRKLWPSWEAFIDTGEKFQKKAPKGTYFFDSGTNIYNAIIGQLNPAYYDPRATSSSPPTPHVKQAWDA